MLIDVIIAMGSVTETIKDTIDEMAKCWRKSWFS